MRARTQAMQSIRATLERLAGIERELVLQHNKIRGLIAQQQENPHSCLLNRHDAAKYWRSYRTV
jgi:hypothetical protein